MTVCIAALYDNGQGCILASDQMTTAHIPIGYEFENEEVEKIVKINDNTFVSFAGDVLFSNEVINRTKSHIANEKIQSVEKIADVLRESYQMIRKIHINRNELEPRGLDLETYINAQQKILPNLVQLIDNAFRTFDPKVEFILAGKDGETCHIYTIVNPGDIASHDPIGFAAIGSGGPHAVYSLIEAKYRKSLDKKTVKQFVQNAKTRSEVAPGVGKLTKIVEI